MQVQPTLPFVFEEEWRAVIGYEGFYEVSNLGRVRRIKFYKHPLGIMKLRVGTTGYYRIGLQQPGEKQRQHSVHAMLLAAFVGPRPKGYIANHIDGNKLHCSLTNLEWVTASWNIKHAILLGLASPPQLTYEQRARGVRAGGAKLTEENVKEIFFSSIPQRALARQYGVTQGTISHIRKGRKWKHVTQFLREANERI